MNGALRWFRARSVREQRLLLLMMAVAVPVLVWLGVWRPLAGALDTARERHAAAVERHGRLLAAAEGLKHARRPAETPGGDLSAYVGEAAANAGLTLASATAQGRDRVAVSITSGDPRAIIGWLRGFEQQGIVVQEARMTPGQSGSAALTAVLSRPGR